MTKIVQENLLIIALEAADKAASFISEQAKMTLKVDFKGATDLVTNADVSSEQIIMETIRARFPDHQILTEEAGGIATGSDYLWVIDPIDGTTNFVHGYPFYAVSIAVCEEEKPIVGVINHVHFGDVYSATAGGGAFCNGEPIAVSTTDSLKRCLLATGFPYEHDEIWSRNMNLFKNFTDLTQGVRRAGAASLDLCHVARGWLDGFWEYELNPWDMAAGAFIVQEAGGSVTKTDGSDFALFDREVLASNGHIHNAMLDQLKR